MKFRTRDLSLPASAANCANMANNYIGRALMFVFSTMLFALRYYLWPGRWQIDDIDAFLWGDEMLFFWKGHVAFRDYRLENIVTTDIYVDLSMAVFFHKKILPTNVLFQVPRIKSSERKKMFLYPICLCCKSIDVKTLQNRTPTFKKNAFSLHNWTPFKSFAAKNENFSHAENLWNEKV